MAHNYNLPYLFKYDFAAVLEATSEETKAAARSGCSASSAPSLCDSTRRRDTEADLPCPNINERTVSDRYAGSRVVSSKVLGGKFTIGDLFGGDGYTVEMDEISLKKVEVWLRAILQGVLDSC
ncbi:hypothetical protein PHMEG_00024297 [Phytophthora megakarya]|uniref:Uncharacterized protein n=1 Tax=Phytophthora megakarya TaxID=4795 RepID=A0A225VGI9_9STRA|nr:hypothetical protein PHMEG_00024297 [Phytophthora megakarya]